MAPVNPLPVIVTEVPTGPDPGEKPVMVGPDAKPRTLDASSEPLTTTSTAAAVTNRRH